jgi:hypothetical protein
VAYPASARSGARKLGRAGQERCLLGDELEVRLAATLGDAVGPFGRAHEARLQARVHAVLHQGERLGAQLADAGLRHAQLGGQVDDGPVLEEQLLDDVLEPLGQRRHRRAQVLQLLVDEQGLLGADARLGDGVRNGAVERLDAEDAAVRVAARGVDLGHGRAQRAGELLAGRCATELRGELVTRRADAACTLAGTAGHPVHRAELVQQRAADAQRGVPGEGNPRGDVERLGGPHQGERAGGGQVVARHIRRDTAEQLGDVISHQREVRRHEGVDACVGVGHRQDFVPGGADLEELHAGNFSGNRPLDAGPGAHRL